MTLTDVWLQRSRFVQKEDNIQGSTSLARHHRAADCQVL